MDPKVKRRGRSKVTAEGTTRVNMYGIDAELWTRLRVHAIKSKTSHGTIINRILRQYLDACEFEDRNPALKTPDELIS